MNYQAMQYDDLVTGKKTRSGVNSLRGLCGLFFAIFAVRTFDGTVCRVANKTPPHLRAYDALSDLRHARILTPQSAMQNTFAGINPNCAVRTPITHMMT